MLFLVYLSIFSLLSTLIDLSIFFSIASLFFGLIIYFNTSFSLQGIAICAFGLLHLISRLCYHSKKMTNGTSSKSFYTSYNFLSTSIATVIFAISIWYTIIKLKIITLEISPLYIFIPSLLIAWAILLIEKRLQEIEKIELSGKFEIKSLRKNIWLFSYIILFIILIFALSIYISVLLKELTYKYIFYTIFLIGIIIFNCYKFLRELKARKYFLTISGKTIKIYYENNEEEFITTDNVNQVRFYVIDTGRGIGHKNPTLQIFDGEEKILVEMTIKIMDYYLLKKYFTKYNVVINDQYNEF
ncbi:hypothetical protein [Fusobacterium sp. 1001295B_180824_G3]|uniref:hypothetical protein n=1 Tax=Fusobacterium sp. 1001295B_180824_G3 TaxID=2787123 RepID=UPI001E6221B1|nr:hypothetical protein [Fusobacterium sp. 1001295B_180824_G3]